MQATGFDIENLYPMQPQGVGTVGRAGGKDSGEGIGSVASGMNLEHVAMSLMQPGDDDDLVANPHPIQAVPISWFDFNESVGSALFGRPGRIFSVLEFRMNHADGLNGKSLKSVHTVWSVINGCRLEGWVLAARFAGKDQKKTTSGPSPLAQAALDFLLLMSQSISE
jgi:hypothetical protein